MDAQVCENLRCDLIQDKWFSTNIAHSDMLVKMSRRLPLCGWAFIALCAISCTGAPKDVTVVGGPGQTNGEGGHASEPEQACQPGSVKTCYSGPQATLDVGVCKAGIATCAPDGAAYGPCTGEVVPKIDDCSTPQDEDCNGTDACEMVEWAKSFGGPKEQGIRNLLAAPDGSIYICGSFSGTVSFGGETFSDHTSPDAYIAKLSASGEHIWSRAMGSTNYEAFYDMALDRQGQLYAVGRVVLSNGANDHVFLTRFDPDGNLLGTTIFGDAAGFSDPSIAITKEDDVVLFMTGRGTVDFGGGPLTSVDSDDVFLAKLDSSGQHLWSKRFGDVGRQMGQAMALDHSGNIIINGTYSGTIDFGGGSLVAFGPGGWDIFIAKFDPDGNHLMSKSYGWYGDQRMFDVTTDSAGNIVVVGTYSDTFDFGGGPLPDPRVGFTTDNYLFLAKLDPWGNHVFSKGFGDSADIGPKALAIDDTGRIAMTFNHNAGGNGFSLDGKNVLHSVDGWDAFVAVFADSGAYQWAIPIGGAQNQWVGSVTFDANGDLLVGGAFEGTVDFGGGMSLTSVASSDIFLAKLNVGTAP